VSTNGFRRWWLATPDAHKQLSLLARTAQLSTLTRSTSRPPGMPKIAAPTPNAARLRVRRLGSCGAGKG